MSNVKILELDEAPEEGTGKQIHLEQKHLETLCAGTCAKAIH